MRNKIRNQFQPQVVTKSTQKVNAFKKCKTTGVTSSMITSEEQQSMTCKHMELNTTKWMC